MASRILSVTALIMMLAGNHASAGESLWRVADRVDIETVPSWFPVGFSLLTHGQRQSRYPVRSVIERLEKHGYGIAIVTVMPQIKEWVAIVAKRPATSSPNDCDPCLG